MTTEAPTRRIPSTYHIVSDLPDDAPYEAPEDLIARLDHVRSRRLVYLQIALVACSRKTKEPAISNAEYRLLVLLVLCANGDLSGSFPSQLHLAERIHWNPRYVRRVIQALVNKGWLRRRTRTTDDGALRSAANQFCVPANAIGKGSRPWVGP